MAMTSRAGRGNVFGPGFTGPNVGPGSYREKDLDMQRVRHSVAPFSSSVERHTTGTAVELATPGPGTYSSNERPTPENVKISSQFASRAPRLLTDTELPKKALTPGPGAYRDPRAEPWQAKLMQTAPPAGAPGRQQSINWIKVATAPSIPAASQSYGYEEGTKGELIQQRAPDRGHAGRGEDTAGPGEYEPIDSLTKPRRAVADFARSRTARESSLNKEVASRPGPGAYEASAGGKQDHRSGEGARATCVFASATVRQFVDKNAAELPGPGAYPTRSGFRTRAEHLAAQTPDVAAFGTTLATAADRFGASASKVVPPALPGPGQYDTKRSSFERDRGRWDVHHGPFCSSSPRFNEHATTDKQTPGPGYYADGTERTSLSVKLRRRIAGRYGVFGTTSQRFPAEKRITEIGPGTYNAADRINPAELRKRDGRTACFVSNVARRGIVDKAQEETPGVGQYETHRGFADELARMQTSYQKGTNALEPRFRPTKAGDLTPGPGQYEAGLHDVSTKVLGGMIVSDRRGRSGRATHVGVDRSGQTRPIGDRALRFPNVKSETPGPGQYEAGNSLVKKTFNITIGDTWD
eukprot:TRINITY_DN60238_c0_g1_i1.p1 TRINITY_DN60238_c0_g1~~TRINITY_DN60238_c0_g1_i1.p1  ORF type:complete len:614 (+),score=169.38 TRINITY_DN60238_c0_g1_i1:98-1843(+)